MIERAKNRNDLRITHDLVYTNIREPKMRWLTSSQYQISPFLTKNHHHHLWTVDIIFSSF